MTRMMKNAAIVPNIFVNPKFENQINTSILGYTKTHSKAYLLSNGCFETGAISSIERENITEFHHSVISSYLRYYVQLHIKWLK